MISTTCSLRSPDIAACCSCVTKRRTSDLIQIQQNTKRAASLVGQLLAYSRKQNLMLEQLDLRDTLSDLTHLSTG